jgi:hypothetical protein
MKVPRVTKEDRKNMPPTIDIRGAGFTSTGTAVMDVPPAEDSETDFSNIPLEEIPDPTFDDVPVLGTDDTDFSGVSLEDIPEPFPETAPQGPTKEQIYQHINTIADTMEDPKKEKKRVHDSMLIGEVFEKNPAQIYDDYDVYVSEIKRLEAEPFPMGPGKAFLEAIEQAAAEKPAMTLRGTTAFTPGKMFGLDPLLERASNYLENLRSEQKKKGLRPIASGKLWPVYTGDKWYEISPRLMPKVMTTWATQVGDQLPLLVTTFGAQKVGEVVGGAVAGGITAISGGGSAAAAPAIAKIAGKLVEVAIGAGPLIALETGAAMDLGEFAGIDKDIVEKYARYYGVGAGVVEYLQQINRIGAFKGFDAWMQKSVAKRILGFIGGSAYEGVEELTQEALQNYFYNLAVEEMKERHPEWQGDTVPLTQNLVRAFAVGAGVSTVIRAGGRVSGMIYHGLDSQIKKDLAKAGIKIDQTPLERAAESATAQMAGIRKRFIGEPGAEPMVVTAEGEPFEFEGLEIPPAIKEVFKTPLQKATEAAAAQMVDVWYHGTRFDVDVPGLKPGTADLGVYLTKDKSYAEKYTGEPIHGAEGKPKILEVYANPKNTLDTRFGTADVPSIIKVADAMASKVDINTPTFEIKGERILGIVEKAKEELSSAKTIEEWKTGEAKLYEAAMLISDTRGMKFNSVVPLRDAIKDQGYDSVRKIDDGADTLIAIDTSILSEKPKWINEAELRNLLKEEGVTSENIDALLNETKTTDQVVREQLGYWKEGNNIGADNLEISGEAGFEELIAKSGSAAEGLISYVSIPEDMSHEDAIAMAWDQAADRIDELLSKRQTKETPQIPSVTREQKEPGAVKGKEWINEAELDVGQTFTIGGKMAEVVSKTESGSLIRYGTSRIPLGSFEKLEIDEGSLSRPPEILEKGESLYQAAKKLHDREMKNFEESLEADLAHRIRRLGGINAEYFQNAAEIAEIPREVRRQVFVSNPNASKLDVVADSLGMSATDLIEALRVYEPLERPTSLKDLVHMMETEHGSPLQKLLAEAEEDERLVKQTRSTLRKAHSLGKEAGIEDARQKYHEAKMRQMARAEYRKRLNKIIENLKRIKARAEHPSKGRPIYGEYITTIRDILDGIDLVRMGKKTLLKLSVLKDFLSDEQNAHLVEIPMRYIKELERLDKTNLNDLTVDQLESIHTAVLHVIHLNEDAQTIRVGNEAMELDMAVRAALAEMRKPKEVVKDLVSLGTESIGEKIENVADGIKYFLGPAHMHYDLMVESLAGPDSVMYKVFYEWIHEGVQTQIRLEQAWAKNFTDAVEPIFTKYRIEDPFKWMNEEVYVGKLGMTRFERIAFYCHSLNEDNRAAAENGIGSRRKKEHRNKSLPLENKGFEKILDTITDAEKEFAGPIHDLFEAEAEKMNKVFEEQNGYPMPRIEGYYYPKDVMPAERKGDTDWEKENAFEKYAGRTLRPGTNKGMLKERVGSIAPLYINPFTYDVTRGIKRAAAYVGLERALHNASKLFYNPEFKGAFKQAYGDQLYKDLEQGLRDIAGQFQSYGFFDDFWLKVRSAMTTAMLSANPFVCLKQPWSTAAYLPYVKMEYLMKGTVECILHGKDVFERHKRFSPELVDRVEGGYSRDVQEVLRGKFGKGLVGKEDLRRQLMKPVQVFDLFGVLPGREGAYLQVLEEFKEGKLSQPVAQALRMKDADIAKLSLEEKVKLAHKYADYAMERTQASARPEHMSPLQKGGPMAKMFTMFSSQTNAMLNLLYRTWIELQRTKDPEAVKKFAWAVVGVSANIAGGVLVDQLRDALYRSKRDREKDKGELLFDILENFASMIFVFGDVVRAVSMGIKRERRPTGFALNLPMFRAVNVAVQLGYDFNDMITAPSRRKRHRAAWRVLDNTLRLTTLCVGLPYDSPMKLTTSVLKKLDLIEER